MFGPNFPFGPGNFMGNFAENMNNMRQNLQDMGQRISEQTRRQAQTVNQYIENLQPGQNRFFNDGNRRGYAYRYIFRGVGRSFSAAYAQNIVCQFQEVLVVRRKS